MQAALDRSRRPRRATSVPAGLPGLPAVEGTLGCGGALCRHAAAHLKSAALRDAGGADFARLLSLIKAVAVLRQHHRRRDASGRLIAEAADYATVYGLVNEMYRTSSGAGEKVRAVVEAVQGLLHDGESLVDGGERERHVKLSQVQARLELSKASCSRRVKAALQGGWLVNSETRKGSRFNWASAIPCRLKQGFCSQNALSVPPFQRKPLAMAWRESQMQTNQRSTYKGGAYGRARWRPRGLLSSHDSQITVRAQRTAENPCGWCHEMSGDAPPRLCLRA